MPPPSPGHPDAVGRSRPTARTSIVAIAGRREDGGLDLGDVAQEVVEVGLPHLVQHALGHGSEGGLAESDLAQEGLGAVELVATKGVVQLDQHGGLGMGRGGDGGGGVHGVALHSRVIFHSTPVRA